jgi:hypothetical protein
MVMEQNPEPFLSVRPKANSWQWLLIGLSICCTLGTIATFAFLWLASLPPVIDCRKISRLSPDIERLYCAQVAAQSGEQSDLVESVKMVEHWSPEHALYHEAQRWVAEWSESILIIAHQKIAQNDVKGAIELAKQVPKSSPIYSDAQKAIAEWQQQWQAGEMLYAKAQDAIKRQQWNEASAQILALSALEFDYWRSQQVRTLSQQVLTEKRARQSLSQAKQVAQSGKAKDLRAAIVLVSTIDHKTYAWSDAQSIFNQWSEALLTIGFQHWQAKKFDDAIILAQQVSLNPTLAEEAQNLIKLGWARKLAFASGGDWEATSKHIWNLMEAIAAARQIKPESRFYPQAQTSLQSWKAQLQDLAQLQYAQLFANFGQKQGLETAIGQAQQVAHNRPRRLQAQTLIAHWSNEIERLEDRPYLILAQALAEPGTISALKTAIAQASKVPMGRVLRGEAQGLIHQWARQIEVLEDKPFLTIARIHASEGNLGEAIRAAAVIRPGRALYSQARAAIAGWRSEIRRIELAKEQAERSRAIAEEERQRQENIDEREIQLNGKVEDLSETNENDEANDNPINTQSIRSRENIPQFSDETPLSIEGTPSFNTTEPLPPEIPSLPIDEPIDEPPPPETTPLSNNSTSSSIEEVSSPINTPSAITENGVPRE